MLSSALRYSKRALRGEAEVVPSGPTVQALGQAAIDSGDYRALAELIRTTLRREGANSESLIEIVRMGIPVMDDLNVNRAFLNLLATLPEQHPVRSKVLRAYKKCEPDTLLAALSAIDVDIDKLSSGAAVKPQFGAILDSPEFGAVGWDTLVVLDRQPTAIDSALLEECLLRDCTVLVSNKGYMKRFPAELANRFGTQIRIVPKISADHDATIFSRSRELAEAIINHVREGTPDPDEAALLRDYAEPARIRLSDLLSNSVRQEILLNATLDELEMDRVLMLSTVSTAQALKRGVSLSGRTVAVTHNCTDLTIVSSEEARTSTLDPAQALQPAPFPVLQPKRLPTLQGYILVCANLVDRQTMGNATALLPSFAKEGPLYVYPAPSDLTAVKRFRPEYEKSELPDLFTSPGVYTPRPPKKPKTPTLLAESKAGDVLTKAYADGTNLTAPRPEGLFKRMFSGSANEPRFGDYSISQVINLVPHMIEHIGHLAKAWDDIVENAGSVIVFPGRHLESLVLVELAKKHTVKSFELQNGTISGDGHYPKPTAGTVFAFEEFSASIYEKLGMPTERIHIVGAPRLEKAIRSVESLSLQEARARTPYAGLPPSEKIITFASQPIPGDAPKRLFEMVVSVVSQTPGSVLLLRPHPSEGAEIIEWYKTYAALNGLGSTRFALGGKDYAELQASDAIITYYSTIGLEGMYLGKPVICATPHEGAPIPYDLTKIGAIGPVSDQAALLKVMSDIVSADPNTDLASDHTGLDAIGTIIRTMKAKPA